MNIKTRILKILKNCYIAVKDFFLEDDKGTKQKLSKLDLAEIFIALSPAAIFGCLLFGWRAVLVLLICIALPIGFDFLWNFIFKTGQKGINYRLAIVGLVLGMTLSSKLNILLVIAAAIITAVLIKTVFKNKPLYMIFPLLFTRALLGLIFFKAFDVYSLPFLTENAQMVPLDYIFGTYSFVYPAKYLFFGMHSGNIGETSVLLLLIGGIYLMLRKIINPVIPTCFIVTAGILSLIFGRNIAISLLGGSLFFAALFLTLDYSFKTTPRYKKILYGVVCGVLTFILREILHAEGAHLAVLITTIGFVFINRKNIKRGIKFIRNPDFKKLLSKLKDFVSV